MKLEEIAGKLGGTLHGDGSLEINRVASLEEAGDAAISYLASEKYIDQFKRSHASAFIVPGGLLHPSKPCIEVADAQLAFVSVLELFAAVPRTLGLMPGAYVDKGAIIGKEASIYSGAYIGRSTLGDRVMVYPGAFIGDDCNIGDDSVIYPNVVIMDGIDIGQRVIIHGGTVIGGDGYGFVWDGKRHRKVPQIGTVVIGDDVEIGANCAIDRAALSKTEIRQGAKIDNLVHIAHNCIIGENSLLAGQVGFAGSVEVGRNVAMGGQAGVSGHLKIGDGVIIAGKAGVTKDLKAGEKVAGFPAISHREWLRVQKTLEKLPEMRKVLKDIAYKIEKLEMSEDKDA
ncbi:MAG: UDP-3-O-(3-hydroxymyristoyl)glucosamine N-acyltransferase [bacterium]|nr:UDP-3-O-(3-hydroxymyristoyl)glucosamine N-acyltransferase [bacterium]